ncbi:MAG: class I SAM-dependent methyltransferase [Firmicutes bacterium]|nr:class I SAM-dependent methyltransferase [Bacillota bacterium]
MKPYGKITTIDMWTDPYISKQMLKYHLNFESDIASRKLDTIKESCKFLLNTFTRGSTICDFGCGPGLYGNYLQQMGYQVIGVDISENSLEYARKQNSNVIYLNMNYVSETLPQKIDNAMMIYCDFGALSPNDRKQFLNNLKKVLNPNGFFIFDVFSDKRFDSLEESSVRYEDKDGFFLPGNAVVESRLIKFTDRKISLSYDKAVGIRTIELYNWDQHYNYKEMQTYMNKQGFRIVDYYSDTVGNKDFTKNDILMFLCQKMD